MVGVPAFNQIFISCVLATVYIINWIYYCLLAQYGAMSQSAAA